MARNFLLARTLEIKQTIDVSHSGHVIGTFLFFFSKKLSQNRPESDTMVVFHAECSFAYLHSSMYRSAPACHAIGQVMNEADVTRALDLARAEFGSCPFVAVNCAGIGYAKRTISRWVWTKFVGLLGRR